MGDQTLQPSPEMQGMGAVVRGEYAGMGSADITGQPVDPSVAAEYTQYRANPAVSAPIKPLPSIQDIPTSKKKGKTSKLGAEETSFLKELYKRATGGGNAQIASPAPQPSLIDRLKAQQQPQLPGVPEGYGLVPAQGAPNSASGTMITDPVTGEMRSISGMQTQRLPQ